MLENVKDRGNKKWAMAMMLTEHVKLLRDWQDEDDKADCPELDGYELELIADEIERAHKSKATLKLTYCRDGHIKDDYGIPIQINLVSRSVVIDDPFGTTRYQFDEIVAASLIEGG